MRRDSTWLASLLALVAVLGLMATSLRTDYSGHDAMSALDHRPSPAVMASKAPAWREICKRPDAVKHLNIHGIRIGMARKVAETFLDRKPRAESGTHVRRQDWGYVRFDDDDHVENVVTADDSLRYDSQVVLESHAELDKVREEFGPFSFNDNGIFLSPGALFRTRLRADIFLEVHAGTQDILFHFFNWDGAKENSHPGARAQAVGLCRFQLPPKR